MNYSKKTWTDEQLAEVIKSSVSFREAILKLNLKVGGGSFRAIKGRTQQLNLDYSHFLGQGANLGKKISSGRTDIKSIDELLVKYEYGTFKGSSSKIKKRLYKENILKEICAICGQLPIWNNKPLVLRLDHISGDPDDYRIENLRILCPNCDSQLPTFTGRNKKRNNLIKQGLDPDDPINHKRKIYKYKYKPVVKPQKASKIVRFCYCGNTLAKKSKLFCSYKCMFENNRKHFPSREILEQHTKDGKSFLSLGKLYNVSDNAVRKWYKYYDLPYKLKDRK
jgi:hypothetical protein